jgi:hypothetical protein
MGAIKKFTNRIDLKETLEPFSNSKMGSKNGKTDSSV